MPDEDQLPDDASVDNAEVSDQALDDLLSDIQSEDPMDHDNEPSPVEEIEAELLPDPDKVVAFGGDAVINRLAEGEAKPTEEEEAKNAAIGKELINNIRGTIKLANERFKEDRLEAQEIIDFLKQVVMSSQKPSTGLVESLVSAMKVKMDATSNLTKIGDMASRALSAGKDHIDKKTSSDTDMDALYDALNTPEYGDEEDRRSRQSDEEEIVEEVEDRSEPEGEEEA